MAGRAFAAHPGRDETARVRPSGGPSLPAVGLSDAARTLLQHAPFRGSATVLASSDRRELADDRNSVTRRLTREATTGVELEQTMAGYDAGMHVHQHPSLAQLGIRPAAFAGRCLATLISNSNYAPARTRELPDISYRDLPGTTRDAERLTRVLQARGFTIRRRADQLGFQISNVFCWALDEAAPNERVFLHYGGHGVKEGMIGVGMPPVTAATAGARAPAAEKYDLAEYRPIVQAIDAAANRGVHVTFVSDACHSGSVAELVREKAIERTGAGQTPLLPAIEHQLGRLREIRARIPLRAGVAGGVAGPRGVILPAEDVREDAAVSYWREVVRPELLVASEYLRVVGIEVLVPNRLEGRLASAITQQVDRFINGFLALATRIERDQDGLLRHLG